jgi:MFS family permease
MTVEQSSVREELFGPSQRAVTVGIVLLITMVAFENMGVGTAMPALIEDLGSVSSYGWPFLAFIATNVIGTVLAGRWSDAHGPRAVLLGAPVVFGIGLLVAGTAATMTQLLIGRVLQGLSAGATGVVVYVLIALIYTPRARPAVFGLMSAAWVVPSLVGPPISALVTEQLSWHWVFLGLVPLVVVALLLVLPASRGLPTPTDPPAARPGLVAAAFAAAFGVSALSWSGQHTTLIGLVIALAAAAVLFEAMRRLVPPGTFTARPGIAAVVAGRALIAGAFFTAGSYLPLMLTSTHGWSLAAASAPLIVGSLGWSGASAWQGRHPDLSRARLLRVGFLLLGAGLAMLVVVAPAWGLPWLALPAVGLAGTGMGLGYSSLSFLLLQCSGPTEVGFNSSSAQLADQLSQAVFVGIGGALLALLATPAAALTLLVCVLTALALCGAAISPRTLRESR